LLIITFWFLGGNEADNRKLKLDSVPVPNIQRSDATGKNSKNPRYVFSFPIFIYRFKIGSFIHADLDILPRSFTAAVSVLQPRNRLNSHHVCPMCPQVVSSEKKLIAHMTTHNGNITKSTI